MINKLRKEITEYFIGKEEVVKNVLICLLAGGHVLIEDVPGVGKTTLVKTLAAAVDLDFGRIQFTPDTLPSDVTGSSVLNMKTAETEHDRVRALCGEDGPGPGQTRQPRPVSDHRGHRRGQDHAL